MKSTRYVLIAGWVFVAMLAGCEPNIAHGDIDLDTTYFPFGLGYEWCYEYHDLYSKEDIYEPIYYEYWDTVVIAVTDSLWQNETLIINLSGSFLDVGDSVEIWRNKLDVFDVFTGPVSYFPGDTISLIPEAQSSTGFSVSYRGDTLLHLYSGYNEDSYVGTGWMYTYRLRGIGVIHQSHGEGHGNEGFSHDFRLLWFYNGKDTIYKAPD